MSVIKNRKDFFFQDLCLGKQGSLGVCVCVRTCVCTNASIS